MRKPLNQPIVLSSIPRHGRFGGKRKFDTHTGVDLYCEPGEPVYAIEDGLVVNVCPFTGSRAKSPWWNNTEAVLVEGASGVILYGEIKSALKTGALINEGDIIGTVKKVLKKDKGLPTTMLHIELYRKGYRGDGEWWRTARPKTLKNIESLLKKLA